jgi:hypothetical protein
MRFEFVKRLDTTPLSIFYSIIPYKGRLIGFGRRHYAERVIKEIELDENFQIIRDNIATYNGEDPRCFVFKGTLYIVDNYLDDMHLINYETKSYIKLQIGGFSEGEANFETKETSLPKEASFVGKNMTFICHGDTLYMIHRMKPFSMYQLDPETGICTPVEVEDKTPVDDFEYRGGTIGYQFQGQPAYYGFGHRTYNRKYCQHDVFLWNVYFEEDRKPRIRIMDIEQPPDSKMICDPTSVIRVGGQWYLITAETNNQWTRDQDYITNVYKIA